MPKIVVKKTEPVLADSDLQKTLVWEVEEDIETCPYRLGKLKLRGAVVGEITLLKNDFRRVARILTELGVRVIIDMEVMESILAKNGQVLKPLPKKGELGY